MTDNESPLSELHKTEPSNTAKSMMLFEANKKSIGVAYLLWFFFGSLGGHRYYAGEQNTAIAMSVIFVVSLLTVALGIGLVGLAVLGIWALVDAFLIPGWIRDFNTKLAKAL